jgi:AcrR family transcriptional regulator
MSTTVGERTRAAILSEAARLATVEGLEGLSIGRLAAALDMSKSGLYAHFRSKEELQLATIDTAQAILQREVIEPGLAVPEGRERLLALCDAYLSHIERDVFPGGCFYAAAVAEVGARDSRVRDAVAGQYEQWIDLIVSLVREAQATGELDGKKDPDQLAFEINALLGAANDAYVLFRDPVVFARARDAISRVVTGDW